MVSRSEIERRKQRRWLRHYTTPHVYIRGGAGALSRPPASSNNAAAAVYMCDNLNKEGVQMESPKGVCIKRLKWDLFEAACRKVQAPPPREIERRITARANSLSRPRMKRSGVICTRIRVHGRRRVLINSLNSRGGIENAPTKSCWRWSARIRI
jgi:hypothetical protein